MTRITIALVIAAVLTIPVPTDAAPAGTDYEKLYEQLWTTVNEKFYDPYFLGTDWKSVRQDYRQRAKDIQTDAQFLALGRDMLAEIGSSHLRISPPDVSSKTIGIGARTRQIAGETLFTDVATLSDARRQGLQPGHRLISPRTALGGSLGSSADIEIETCDGARRWVEIKREVAYWPPDRPGFNWSQIRIAPNKRIGFIEIGRFDDGAAKLADRAMADLMDTQAIIIDVRHNSGGNASALRLASYFGRKAQPAFVLFGRPYLEELDGPLATKDIESAPRVHGAHTDEAVFQAMAKHNGGVAFWTDSMPQRYQEPVFVLIGDDTGSAAEGFAWAMRETTDAVLIGRATAGDLLSGQTFEIDKGWSVTLPVHGIWGVDGTNYGDRAVPPHQEIAWAQADLCNGRDPDLEAALSQVIDG